jgi:cystathionine beta-lyase/cystathionine gamma-synthase
MGGVSAVAAARSLPAEAPPVLVAEALVDLHADFDELLFLCRSADAELEEADIELDALRASLHGPTRELLARQLQDSRGRHRAAAERLLSLRELARRGPRAPSPLEELSAAKASLADLLRAEQALTAALVAAADWQSPSFLHSTLPAAGRQSGRIRPHWNDYKRDRHLDAEAYERRYLQAMVDGPAGLRALLASCGMAAFTTVLSFLLSEAKLNGLVLVGAGLYHESRLLLERALPGRVRPVDEGDTRALVRAIDELRPSAIFLDSLSNTRWMPVPELQRVVGRLRGTGIYLIVDNTGLSVSCQPFALADESVRLIVFESLLKYAQLGLDRVNAGVIVARGDDAELLADYREHLGTNVADVAVHALPRPDRRVLERRLARLQRNALLLANRLHERTSTSVAIVYPGLAPHPCSDVGRRLPFRGGCLSIVPHESDGRLTQERWLVKAAVAEAARRGVPLLGGSSFGFNTSRIYLTAADAEQGDPFVRVAAGTEHRLELEALADALTVAVREVTS